MTDEALMLAVRDGDLASLAPLFERYHRVLFDFLSRMTGNRTAAEDLVQDVFMRVLKYRGTYRGGGFQTWLFRIARNARADYFKDRPAHETLLDEDRDYASPAPGADAALSDRDNTARLARALSKLRQDQRELIVLARYQGLKYDAIADILDVELGTVKVRMHRAIKELRRIYLSSTETQPWNATLSERILPNA